MAMPRIAFRVAGVSAPFNNGTEVEVKIEVVVRLRSGARGAVAFERKIDAHAARMLPPAGKFYRVAAWEEGEL